MASSLNGTGVTFSDGSTQSTGTTGNFQFNSGYGSVATAYGCRAWVNFDGSGTIGANQTIRGSGNVSSVRKNATGDYTVNFTNAMTDANYSTNVSRNNQAGVEYGFCGTLIGSRVSSSCRVTLLTSGGSGADSSDVSVAIFR